MRFYATVQGPRGAVRKVPGAGFEILGFPCNQFGKQDPGSNDEIVEFCQLNYGVSFPMFGKIEVNGEGADPLFRHLKKQAPGALGTEGIKWNFTKFLVDADGNVVKRYAPKDKPAAIEKDIESLLPSQEPARRPIGFCVALSALASRETRFPASALPSVTG